MGNCLGTDFVKSHKRIRPHGGEEEEVEALCNGNKIGQDSHLCKKASALPSKTELEEDHILELIQHCSPPDVAEDCNSQRVKIVVTRMQLELLIRSGVELHLRRISSKSRVRRTCKQWRPCLATIPEL
ncbi:unnamed protein product [Fraxinus pennsylvanica]|uniref:Uncharacterized protein n=1 Tax=Fraxinus pennsylvanica TaxID=56036 RepID=A0AAD1YTE3_9LAMI|nr:unnamed protein product [Fraxinus pennsylvanica]